MPALVAGIHVLLESLRKGVDRRVKFTLGPAKGGARKHLEKRDCLFLKGTPFEVGFERLSACETFRALFLSTQTVVQ